MVDTSSIKSWLCRTNKNAVREDSSPKHSIFRVRKKHIVELSFSCREKDQPIKKPITTPGIE